jgi:hypothetical protein
MVLKDWENFKQNYIFQSTHSKVKGCNHVAQTLTTCFELADDDVIISMLGKGFLLKTLIVCLSIAGSCLEINGGHTGEQQCHCINIGCYYVTATNA